MNDLITSNRIKLLTGKNQMAEKVPIPKLKKVVTYESSDDESEVVDDDLELPLDKLVLGPAKKKLLILCLGGLLVHRVHERNQYSVRRYSPADMHLGRFLVFKRPFCTEFVKFCFERFDVALWSSARDHNIDGLLSNITGGMKNKLLFVWSQEECTDSGFMCLHNDKKQLFLKDLKSVWENSRYSGKYSASDTLLIDDEPHTCLLNPPNTAIFPKSYKVSDTNDTSLGPNGELREFLKGLADAEDVQSYVKDHRIGQPQITEGHQDWSYYAKVVRRFR